MYTAQELADAFGFSVKTIHMLVWQGVLPPPTGRTRAARYSQRHWDLLVSYRKQIPHRGDRTTRSDLTERLRRTGALHPPRVYRIHASPTLP